MGHSTGTALFDAETEKRPHRAFTQCDRDSFFPAWRRMDNGFWIIPYPLRLPAPVYFLSGWVGAGTSFKAQCFRPRPKSDFYTCKIREWIFEGLPFGSLGYLRETSRAREELILFLKTMQIFKIISVERKGLPFFGKHYSGGVMLRNGKVSRAIGRYIGSWKYDKSWHLGG